MKKTSLVTAFILAFAATASVCSAQAQATTPKRASLPSVTAVAAQNDSVASETTSLPTVTALENEMLSRMDEAIQTIAGRYGNPRFVRLMTNDPAASEQFKARLELARSRGELAAALDELELKRAELDAQIELRTKTLAEMDARLIRARSALDVVSESTDRIKRFVEGAAIYTSEPSISSSTVDL